MEDKTSFLDEEWLLHFYDRVTDQFTLSRNSLHNTHQWTITLTFGVITAIFTLSNKSPYPNLSGFIILVLTLPLLLRFFTRSCLEYSIQRKWQELRNNLDKYFLNQSDNAKQELIDSIQKYYFQWKSPISIWKILKDNLILAYLWPLLIYITLILWGLYLIIIPKTIFILMLIVLIDVIYEIVSLFCYRGFKRN